MRHYRNNYFAQANAQSKKVPDPPKFAKEKENVNPVTLVQSKWIKKNKIVKFAACLTRQKDILLIFFLIRRDQAHLNF